MCSFFDSVWTLTEASNGAGQNRHPREGHSAALPQAGQARRGTTSGDLTDRNGLVRVAGIRRCPVKSMQGETPSEVGVDATGVVGDRAYALVDAETGAVASAKDPRRWAGLLGFSAQFSAEPGRGQPVTITLPGGVQVSSTDPDIDRQLSSAAGRAVTLSRAPALGASYDEVWPGIDGLAPEEFVASQRTGQTSSGEAVTALPVGMLAPGTFQDVSPVTILTTASLRAARRLHPAGDWDPRRFRMTVVIDADGDSFIENDWLGRTLTIGSVRFSVFAPTPRCVMVTLAQPGLAADREVLATVARHNRAEVPGAGRFACLGAYASVDLGGTIRVGDNVELA